MRWLHSPRAVAQADRAPLPIDGIIRRLRDSFAHVESDAEEASRQRVRRAVGRAVYVVLADEPNTGGRYLSFLLEPEHETNRSRTSDTIQPLGRVLEAEDHGIGVGSDRS